MGGGLLSLFKGSKEIKSDDGIVLEDNAIVVEEEILSFEFEQVGTPGNTTDNMGTAVLEEQCNSIPEKCLTQDHADNFSVQEEDLLGLFEGSEDDDKAFLEEENPWLLSTKVNDDDTCSYVERYQSFLADAPRYDDMFVGPGKGEALDTSQGDEVAFVDDILIHDKVVVVGEILCPKFGGSSIASHTNESHLEDYGDIAIQSSNNTRDGHHIGWSIE